MKLRDEPLNLVTKEFKEKPSSHWWFPKEGPLKLFREVFALPRYGHHVLHIRR